MTIARELAAAVAGLVEGIVTAAKGMLVTVPYLLQPSRIVTVQYPREKLPVAPAFRGRLYNDVDVCGSCELCARACPTRCIKVTHETGADKKRILKTFEIDMTTCLYCGLCVEACPTGPGHGHAKSLSMSGEYEYSSDRKEAIRFEYFATEEELAGKRAAAVERERIKQDKLKAAAAAAPAPTKPAGTP